MSVDKMKTQKISSSKLRQQAEERLQAVSSNMQPPRTMEETQRLIHELEVHQIELEMQNVELLLTRAEVEKSLDYCTDLYDFAPIGYFSLDSNGIITAVNLTGAALLGIERTALIGRNFGQFVVKEYGSVFTSFLAAVFSSREKKGCQTALLNSSATPLFVQIEAISDDAGQISRLALIDITARNQAEEALRSSEDQMYKLAEMSVDAIIMLDDNGLITFCNASVENMFGCSAADITGQDFHQLFIPGRLLDAAKRGFERFKEHGTGQLVGRTTEVIALRKDGTEFPLELSVSALNIKKKWHAIAIMRDVSERKKLEADIQNAREYAENIVESVRRPLLVLDSDLKILTANQNYYRTFMTTPVETIGKSIYELGNRQWDTPKLREHFKEIFNNSSGYINYHVEHEFKSIGHKIIMLNARQIFQKNVGSRIILLAMEDITARKQLETEVQDAREYAENIVETVREPLVVLNSDLKILTANHSFYKTFRVTPEATIGNFIYDVGNRQWDIPKLRVLIEEILPLDTVINDYEVEHDFPDIGQKIILLNARQIFRNNIGSRIILLAMEDITERRHISVALQKSEHKFSKIFNSVPALINISTLNEGTIIDVNKTSLHTLGYQRNEMIGKTVHELGFWEDESERARLIQIIKTRGSVQNLEIRFKGKNGQTFIGLLSAELIDIDSAQCMLTLVRDITARKQLEREIQIAREYAENIVETVREPLVVLNSDLKILTANLSFYGTFMVTPEETIGNFIYDIGNRQWDIAALRVLFEEILPHDTVINGYEVEHDFLGIGHKTILLNARQIFRENVGSRIILLAMEDITARKQLEAEIQDALEYSENIVETVREPLVVINSDLIVLTANQSFYNTFKVTPKDTIGNYFYDLGNRQWDIPKLRILVEKILPHDTVINDYEVEHDFLDIGRKIILLNARQIFRENIGSRIILLAMEDITARKKLETEIQDAREYAENIVETVRESLVVLNSDLKILTANHSFYETFKVTPEVTIGNFIYDLGNRQWDIPKLRVLVEEILPNDTEINDYEVEHDFLDIGHKIILLNARQIFRENIGSHIILLAMEDITDRKRLEKDIQDAREYAENIVETVREPMVVLSSELKILTANHSFYETFKVTQEATIGRFIYDVGNRQWDIPRLRILFEEILPLDTVINDYVVEHDFPGIGHKVILLNARQIFRENIGSHIILLAMEDITERKRLEERAGEVIRQQQAILNNIPNIAWLKDREGRYLAVNDPFGKSFGMAPSDLIGKNDFDIYPYDMAVKYEKDFEHVISTGSRTFIEESIIDHEGRNKYVEKIKTPIFNDAGVVIGIIGIAHDITNRKEVEDSLRHDSTHDTLTGLYNRAFFDEELERLTRSRMFPISVVMADINGLKTVNDTLGHAAGDNLIRLAAHIILTAFRAEDIVARLGGDEFAVLLPNTESMIAEDAVKRIMNCSEIVNGQVTIAFGIATAENKEQLSHALHLSDERMYQDKSKKKVMQEQSDKIET